MEIVKLLENKSNGNELTEAEIKQFVQKVLDNSIHEAQIGAFLMTIKNHGMSLKETTLLTQYMAKYSKRFNWSEEIWSNQVVDKHSTGGVGDKISLILAPVVAALNVKVPMISGRGLGITGGTIDKLESLTGYTAQLDNDRLIILMRNAGFFIIGQSEDLVPVDKKLYAIRDITGTVNSIPLIAASILSKKLCEGICGLVMDVKVGLGSQMKNVEDGKALSKTLRELGAELHLPVVTVMTQMDAPLGHCIGNALEMAEVFDILTSKKIEFFEQNQLHVLYALSSEMLRIVFPDIYETNEAVESACRKVLLDGSAANCLKTCLAGQGVSVTLSDKLCQPVNESIYTNKEFIKEINCANGYDHFALIARKRAIRLQYLTNIMGQTAPYSREIIAPETGIIVAVSALTVGLIVRRLGAGRMTPNQQIDHSVGIHLLKTVGNNVMKGEPWAVVWYNKIELTEDMFKELSVAITINKSKNTLQNQSIVIK